MIYAFPVFQSFSSRRMMSGQYIKHPKIEMWYFPVKRF